MKWYIHHVYLSIVLYLSTCNSIIVQVKNDYWSNDSILIEKLYKLPPECCQGNGNWIPYRSCSDEIVPERYIGPCSAADNISYIDYYNVLNETRRNIIILGDSLSRQWFENLVCYLNITTWTGFTNNYKEELKSTIGVIPMLSTGQVGYSKVLVGKSSIIYYNIAHISVSDIKNIILYHNDNNNTSDYGYRIVLDYKSIHFRDINTDYDTFKLGLNELVSYCITINAMCVLRETTAQHFVNHLSPDIFENGLYNSSYNRLCYKYSYLESYDSVARWRNELIWKLRQGLMVIPCFDALIAKPNCHNFKNEENDCAHLAFNHKYWEPLHLALLMNLKNKTCHSSFDIK